VAGFATSTPDPDVLEYIRGEKRLLRPLHGHDAWAAAGALRRAARHRRAGRPLHQETTDDDDDDECAFADVALTFGSLVSTYTGAQPSRVATTIVYVETSTASALFHQVSEHLSLGEHPTETLLDVNRLVREHNAQYLEVGVFEVCPYDERLLAYSIDLVGNENFTLRFRNVADAAEDKRLARMPGIVGTSRGMRWVRDDQARLWAYYKQA